MSPFSFVSILPKWRSGSLRRAEEEKTAYFTSAINRQILQAEESFGTPLFERLPEELRDHRRRARTTICCAGKGVSAPDAAKV